MTDYSEYVPMKKTSLDMNNLNDKARKGDHMYSDILGGERPMSAMKSPDQRKKADEGNS
jgi:hypothetical protein